MTLEIWADMLRLVSRIPLPSAVIPSGFGASNNASILTQNQEVKPLHDPRHDNERSF
jgi:hypothetical protein